MLQVLSVPFYAWDQAQSLQQRAAYLDCLLGSQSSHLATSQVYILLTTPGGCRRMPRITAHHLKCLNMPYHCR